MLLRWLAGLFGLGGALGYIGFVDPHRRGAVLPLCPFQALTGWDCPACGGLRMIHDLLHGDLAAAVADNAFFLVGIPILAGWLLLRRRRSLAVTAVPVLVVVATAIAWTLLRNLPGFPLLPILITD